jgi:hypothetical protein
VADKEFILKQFLSMLLGLFKRNCTVCLAQHMRRNSTNPCAIISDLSFGHNVSIIQNVTVVVYNADARQGIGVPIHLHHFAIYGNNWRLTLESR